MTQSEILDALPVMFFLIIILDVVAVFTGGLVILIIDLIRGEDGTWRYTTFQKWSGWWLGGLPLAFFGFLITAGLWLARYGGMR